MPVDLTAMMVTALLVTAVVLFASGVRAFAARGDDSLAQRLGALGAPEAASAGPVRRHLAAALARALAPLARLAQPKGEQESHLRHRLAQAGLRAETTPTIFLAAKVLAATAGLGGFVWVSATRVDPLPLGPALGVLPFAIGYYLPDAWLAGRIRARQTAIERGLPDALDLLVTCVEAGLGLDQAMQRVANEIAIAWPELAQELRLTFLEVNAGIRRVEAMRRLAHRTGVSELKSLAATLNQTEIFGTSVGAALRVQSESMRIRRMQRAEERAGIVSVKLMVPLVVCVLPSLMAVIIGPAVVNIVNTLFPALQRHP